MNLIACVDSHWGIGNKGKKLVSIPSDQKLLQELTSGKVVVAGRKTMESLPGGTTLKGRKNIVLSSRKDYSYGDAKVVYDMEEAIKELSLYNDDDIYIIGGAKVYEEFLPYCKRAFITKIDYVYEADCFLQNLDKSEEWIMTHDTEEQTYYDLEYRFYQYQRK